MRESGAEGIQTVDGARDLARDWSASQSRSQEVTKSEGAGETEESEEDIRH